uniref:Diacylglycerol kinase n=1 Tax=Albugo laibachii Nc14 TaxID=890382 RepID=F0WTL9_9STRA|nr:diacylglycerol kinase putative [Albugo laibachii Nc14]|eukprot:CCA24710.1 diacylglycerol kinase putative [Albugo laibachii Nc14]
MYGIRSYVVTCDICGMFAHAQCAASIIKCRTTSANLMSGRSSEPDALESKRTSMDTTELEDMKNREFTADDERGVDRYTNQSNGHDKRIARCFCKVAAVKTELKGYTHQHFWVRGNTDPMDKCSICDMFCGSILTLSGMKCAWCHVRVHESCFSAQRSRHQTLRRCELGRHRKSILPPYAVILRELTQPNVTVRALSSVRDAAQFAVTKMATVRNRRSGSITSHENATRDDVLIEDHATKKEPEGTNIIAPPPTPTETPTSMTLASRFEFHIPPDIIPLLVLINSKSGGKLGLHILRQARKYLNPIQVYDVAHQNPMSALNDFKELPRLRILACGGDGTVGWILNCLDDVVPSRQLPVAVLPLGTGNDLARVLGWGSGLSCGDFSERLPQVESAHVSLLDRWNVRINGNKRTVMNNYLGIGVDAQVALEFHKQRERIPGLFMSQFVNKLWYSQLGAKNFLVRTCAGLASRVDLICDDCDIVLPEGTEGVIFLNINSYGGGSKLWHDESDEESGWENSEDEMESVCVSNRILDSKSKRRELKASSPNDGLLDVVAVYGTLHLGQMQVGLSKAVRLCQCRKAEIRLKDTLPLQIDGEPWLQNACILTVSFHDQAHMLGRSVPECDNVTHRVGDVLNWAENTNIISSSQRDILLAEIARHVTSSSPAGIDGENGTAGTRHEARISNASY